MKPVNVFSLSKRGYHTDIYNFRDVTAIASGF